LKLSTVGGAKVKARISCPEYGTLILLWESCVRWGTLSEKTYQNRFRGRRAVARYDADSTLRRRSEIGPDHRRRPKSSQLDRDLMPANTDAFKRGTRVGMFRLYALHQNV